MNRCLASLLLLSAALCGQTTWYVDAASPPPGSGTKADPFRSITSALNAAGPNDTILVAPGTYSPSLTAEVLPIALGTNAAVAGSPIVNHTNLKLIAEAGPFQTIIDCEGSTRNALRFFASAPGSIVRGFTIRNCANGFVIRSGSSTSGFEGAPNSTLDGCIVEARPGSNSYAYALLFAGNDHRIINNWFVGPFLSDVLWLSNDGAPGIGGGLVAHNVIDGSLTNGIRIQGGLWTVQNNIISNCAARGVLDFRPVGTSVPTTYNFNYNCFFGNGVDFNDGGTGGTGLSYGPNDLLADPQFVNRTAQDFRLSSLSPCRDAGTLVTPAELVWRDIEGDARVLPSPAGVLQSDIGADEVSDARMVVTIPPSLSFGVLAFDVQGQAGDIALVAFSLGEAPIFIPNLGPLRLSLDPLQFFFLNPMPEPLISGTLSVGIPIASLPLGATAFTQALVAGPTGVRLTNALRLVVCP